MESKLRPKFVLGKIKSKYLILEVMFYSFFKQRGCIYLHQASKSLRMLLLENSKAAEVISEDALSHI